MLKGIPSILPPELLKILMEMGHGDEIVIADGNFPGASHARNLVRCDGHGVSQVLEAVLRLFPLDSYVPQPVALMQVVPGDPVVPVIWDKYHEIVRRWEPQAEKAGFEEVERSLFYQRAKNAYAVVTTGETAIYANILLRKGIITGENAL